MKFRTGNSLHNQYTAFNVSNANAYLCMNFSHYVFRLASPRHGFTIMNRLRMENLTEPITKDLDFQLQDPFLLYRNARCKEKNTHTHTHFLCFPDSAFSFMPETFCSQHLLSTVDAQAPVVYFYTHCYFF